MTRSRSSYDENAALAAAIAASQLESQEEASLQGVLDESKVQASTDPRMAHHLTLYHYPNRIDEKKGHFKVKIPGGGNCGFYAIALGIVNLVVQDKIQLTTEKYTTLLGLLKAGPARENINARLDFYRTGRNPKQLNPPRLKKCVPFIDAILKEIDQGNLESLYQLKTYILQNMHSQQDKDYFLESLLIVLGPVLRQVSVLEFEKLSEKKEEKRQRGTASILRDASHIQMQPEDGVDVSEEQLNLLSGFFGFEFQAYLQTPKRLYFKSFSAFEIAQEITHSLVVISPAGVAPDQKPAFQACEDFVAAEKKLMIQVIYNPVAQHWDLLLPYNELQRPPYLFSFFESRMLQEQVDLEIMSMPQYSSRRREADEGKPVFDSGSYCLIADQKKDQATVWHFVHVNNSGEHHALNIKNVENLEQAIARLPKKDPGSMEAKDKKEVVDTVKEYLSKNHLLWHASGSGDVFDERKLPEELEKIRENSKKDQAKLFLLLDSIATFAGEVRKITNQDEKKIGENLVETLRNTVNTLVDPLAEDSQRILGYKECLHDFNAALSGMPSMTPSCANTLLNIIAGILTIGIWHCIQRHRTGQWTLSNDLKAAFYDVKRKFESLTEQVKKLDNDTKHPSTPGKT